MRPLLLGNGECPHLWRDEQVGGVGQRGGVVVDAAHEGEQIGELAVVRHRDGPLGLHVRPVGAPHETVGRDLDQRMRKEAYDVELMQQAGITAS